VLSSHLDRANGRSARQVWHSPEHSGRATEAPADAEACCEAYGGRPNSSPRCGDR